MFSIFRNLMIAMCLIGFGVLLTVAGHKNASEFASLRDHGKTAEADVTKLKWTEKKSNNDDRSYTAYVRFTTEDGQTVQEDMQIPVALGRAIREKTAPPVMTVRYLPESPSTFRDASTSDPSEAQSGIGRYMVLAGIIMLVLRFIFKE